MPSARNWRKRKSKPSSRPRATGASPRELAVRFIDEKRYFVSEATVYRLLKAHDLITSPAYIVIKAAVQFHTMTTRPNEMWQTDFPYFKIIGWGCMYLSTARRLLALPHRLEVVHQHVRQGHGACFLAAQLGNAVIPRRPSSTTLILSSAEKCRRVCRRMAFTTRSSGAFTDNFSSRIGASSSYPSSLRRSPNPP